MIVSLNQLQNDKEKPGVAMSRNPAWTDEEIILATEVYVRAGGRVLGPKDPEVIELSKLLRTLDIHEGAARNEKFRNPQGVGMKLANIRGADPTREGGLINGSRRDGLFWEEMDGNERILFHYASIIRQAIPRRDSNPNS